MRRLRRTKDFRKRPGKANTPLKKVILGKPTSEVQADHQDLKHSSGGGCKVLTMGEPISEEVVTQSNKRGIALKGRVKRKEGETYQRGQRRWTR